MQITRSELQDIIRTCAQEAGVRQVDYESMFDTFDRSKGVSFLTFGSKYGCPLTQAFGGHMRDGLQASRYVDELRFFKDLFDEAMMDRFEVDGGLGMEYNVDITG